MNEEGTTKAARDEDSKTTEPLPNYDLAVPDREQLIRENLADIGARQIQQDLEQHKSVGPLLTGGDLDADWQGAESVGDEAVGGHSPTPDQNVIDELGRAVGYEERDEGELHVVEERAERRDKERWELDRRSADDQTRI